MQETETSTATNAATALHVAAVVRRLFQWGARGGRALYDIHDQSSEHQSEVGALQRAKEFQCENLQNRLSDIGQ